MKELITIKLITNIIILDYIIINVIEKFYQSELFILYTIYY